MRSQPQQSNQSASGAAAQDVIEFGPSLSLRGVRMRFERNEEIFGESECAEYVYRVVSGAVRTMRFSSDGRRQILGFHLPGDVFGWELSATHTLSAEAVSAADVIMVRRSLVEKASAQDLQAAHAVLALTAQSLNTARDHAVVLGRKGAGERVAAFLVQLADRFVSRTELDLPMSRADIADYLGLTIETVSRTFSEMERQCAIALPSSRHVVMRNPAALAELQIAA
jgi:CRP/FNR family transcriptional regulator, nitrogen fixation regulation protein